MNALSNTPFVPDFEAAYAVAFKALRMRETRKPRRPRKLDHIRSLIVKVMADRRCRTADDVALSLNATGNMRGEVISGLRSLQRMNILKTSFDGPDSTRIWSVVE